MLFEIFGTSDKPVILSWKHAIFLHAVHKDFMAVVFQKLVSKYPLWCFPCNVIPSSGPEVQMFVMWVTNAGWPLPYYKLFTTALERTESFSDIWNFYLWGTLWQQSLPIPLLWLFGPGGCQQNNSYSMGRHLYRLLEQWYIVLDLETTRQNLFCRHPIWQPDSLFLTPGV